ncbi:teichoic acid export protein ATP-binding subunit [Bacillus cereus]|uniref:teichoic acids export ABC transporter ATP-binding subunit TagH n=1 Tax=Bacillus nitratireducens TaxID=2026193 RepID=UPI000278F7E0|nr:teichoic acids export ATP-binding protein TagH [Bacillus cereus BAG3X2-1]PEA19351.1 teichoic acid export protein ATP-binding subunit [Bacillus cereus]PEU05565.1 teichoic acid export protein ATP-binding subunit [Bacillus cereus]PEV97058.1 teichoic acid export protein ATP-binding subunit [Bacillus cereus]PFA34894.1 teichoic acid export protein ATP-binding subunit [Bacillus cereus]
MNYTVKFQNVTKKYKMYNKPSDKLKDLFRKQEDGEFHYALSDVSFEVPKGEIIGIIGLNGSGKSTLSNLIAGVTMPNKGEIDIKGSAALIAISSGLNGQLSGIENIELKGLMMGLTKEKVKEIIPQIIEFADIGKFINQPVKTYSSGMKARLGFAISVNINPDVLVIDEALSVGDQTFTNKCLKKMNEFKEKGKTIFFISHSLNQVNSFCTKAIWLYYGQVREYGDVKDVVANYRTFLKEYNQMPPAERKKLQEKEVSQFQHGLLQEYPTNLKRKNRKFKLPPRKPKKKNGVIIGTGIALLVCGVLAGSYYKGWLPLQNGNKNVEKTVQSKNTNEDSQIKMPAKDERYLVNSNEISIRKEASTSSERLAVANFGDIFTVSDRKKDTANTEWGQVKLPSGETGWLSTQYAVPFAPKQNMVEDSKLDDLLSLLKRVYGTQIKDAPSYLGKTEKELQTTYPDVLNPLQTVAGKTIVKDGNIQFGISQDKVVDITLQNISLSVAKLHEVLGKESMSNNEENNYFYETSSYYIAARSDETHKEIQSISIVKK